MKTIEEKKVRKLIREQRPKAILKKIRLSVAYYEFDIVVADGLRAGYSCQIPVDAMNFTTFYDTMEAANLLLWLKPDHIIYFKTLVI